MDNRTHLCKCLRCPEEGRLVTKTNYYTHRQRYGTRDGSRPPPPPPEVSQPQPKRAKAGPSVAEELKRLEDMYNEYAALRSAPPFSMEAAPPLSMEAAHRSESPLVMEFTGAEEQIPELTDDFDDAVHQLPHTDESGRERNEDWLDLELSEDDAQEGDDNNEGGEVNPVLEQLFSDRGDSAEQEVALTPEQQRRDSWVWKLHALILFMMSFTGLSQSHATLILSFVFCVMVPDIQRACQDGSGVIQVERRDRLVTPTAVTRSLGLTDSFKRYLVCLDSACCRLNLWDGKVPANGSLLCQYCGKTTMENRKPKLEYAHRSIAETLLRVLQDEQIESALDEWKADLHERQESQDRRYGPIWSGSAWRQDCTNFACSVPCLHGHKPFVDDGDLNLKISLNIDWFGPHKGRHTGYHSTGVILIRIDNIPERFNTLDRRCLGIHVLGLMPGPRQPPARLFYQYQQLVVEELIDLDKIGIVVPTAKHPEGRKVRVRLNMAVADSPARAKLLDFDGSFWNDPICPYCPKSINMFGTREPWEEGPRDSRPPPPTTETAARCQNTLIKELKYFNLVLNAPPDPMHAVHLGMCNRFWRDFLILSCKKIAGELEKAQRIIFNAMIPIGFKRPDDTFGDKGAGKPTAEQWVTLYRCLLPFIMLSLWQRSLLGTRDQALSFHPPREKSSNTRPPKTGLKKVREVYRVGMLLCCIVELIEEDLDEVGIEELRGFIVDFNVRLKDLLGNGWLTYNTHISEHIPDAIERFGAGRNFSCLPFERCNGKLGNVSNAGQKKGKMETTIMRTVVRQQDLRRMLAQSSDPFLKNRLLGHVQSTSERAKGTSSTRMNKVDMELNTFLLLLDHLNGPTKRIRGKFKDVMDRSRTLDDVPLEAKAQYLRTVVIESYPSETRITSAASSKGVSKGNSYALIKIADGDGDAHAVHILWLFELAVVLHGRGTPASREKYMHVRKLKMVPVKDAMLTTETHGADTVLCEDLLERMKITFASQEEDGEELVVPLSHLISQLAVVPLELDYRTPNKVYGLKAL